MGMIISKRGVRLRGMRAKGGEVVYQGRLRGVGRDPSRGGERFSNGGGGGDMAERRGSRGAFCVFSFLSTDAYIPLTFFPFVFTFPYIHTSSIAKQASIRNLRNLQPHSAKRLCDDPKNRVAGGRCTRGLPLNNGDRSRTDVSPTGTLILIL